MSRSSFAYCSRSRARSPPPVPPPPLWPRSARPAWPGVFCALGGSPPRPACSPSFCRSRVASFRRLAQIAGARHLLGQLARLGVALAAGGRERVGRLVERARHLLRRAGSGSRIGRAVLRARRAAASPAAARIWSADCRIRSASCCRSRSRDAWADACRSPCASPDPAAAAACSFSPCCSFCARSASRCCSPASRRSASFAASPCPSFDSSDAICRSASASCRDSSCISPSARRRSSGRARLELPLELAQPLERLLPVRARLPGILAPQLVRRRCASARHVAHPIAGLPGRSAPGRRVRPPGASAPTAATRTGPARTATTGWTCARPSARPAAAARTARASASRAAASAPRRSSARVRAPDPPAPSAARPAASRARGSGRACRPSRPSSSRRSAASRSWSAASAAAPCRRASRRRSCGCCCRAPPAPACWRATCRFLTSACALSRWLSASSSGGSAVGGLDRVERRDRLAHRRGRRGHRIFLGHRLAGLRRPPDPPRAGPPRVAHRRFAERARRLLDARLQIGLGLRHRADVGFRLRAARALRPAIELPRGDDDLLLRVHEIVDRPVVARPGHRLALRRARTPARTASPRERRCRSAPRSTACRARGRARARSRTRSRPAGRRGPRDTACGGRSPTWPAARRSEAPVSGPPRTEYTRSIRCDPVVVVGLRLDLDFLEPA